MKALLRRKRGEGIEVKRWVCALLALAALLSLSGCRSAFEREYYYEAPYAGDIGMPSGRATEIRNYNMLKTALTNMITTHTETGELRFTSYNGSVSEDLAAVCFEIKSEHPLGAYAVETLSYDTSYVVSYYVANIFIGYKRTADELRSIVYTSTEEDFDAGVTAAMDAGEPQLTIRCFAPGIDEAHIRALVRRHYFDEPVGLIAEPQAEVTSYPAGGANCIFEVRFLYGLSAERSAAMSQTLSGKLQEAAAAMTETEQPKKALEAARYLSEHCVSAERTSADTAYGALVLGYADSKGLALAYRALCAALGIECTVVEGGYGSIGAEPHYWNIIGLGEDHYHVDVSALAEDPAGAFLVSDEVFWGRCIWETEDYPACEGPLRYSDVAELPAPEEPKMPPEAEPPEETETPEATDAPQESPEPAAEATPEPDAPGPEAEAAEKPEKTP